MTALFALATSVLWGLADFGGGLLTRRTPALAVVVRASHHKQTTNISAPRTRRRATFKRLPS